MEVLLPSDPEAAVVRELRARMTVQIGTQVPRPRPGEFGRVVGTGGAPRDLVSDSPTLTLEGFAETEGRAWAICAEMVAHVQAAARSGSVGGVTAYGARVAGLPANLPMPSVPDRYRYTATVAVDLRRVVA